jgi:hypothetical protein
MARPAGFEPATLGSGGRTYGPARNRLRRFHLIFRPFPRVGGNRFPPQTTTICHTAVTPQPFPTSSAQRTSQQRTTLRIRDRSVGSLTRPGAHRSVPTAKLGEQLGHWRRCPFIAPCDRLQEHLFRFRVGLERLVAFECQHDYWRALGQFGIELDTAGDDLPRCDSHTGILASSGGEHVRIRPS